MRSLFTLALALHLIAVADLSAAARGAVSVDVRAVPTDHVNTTRVFKKRGTSVASRGRARKKRVVVIPYDMPPVPPAVTEVDLEGLKKLLQRDSDLSKARPLLVNFWATWCDPCRAEFPDLVKINNDYRDRGLDFVVISGDDISEIKTGVPKFLSRMRATMPAYLLNVPDMEAAINAVDATWGGDMPATFLFDRDGKIAFKHFGRIKPEEVRAALDRVLGSK
jgi:thiol-disulfide isomerase/thioredoxin